MPPPLLELDTLADKIVAFLNPEWYKTPSHQVWGNTPGLPSPPLPCLVQHITLDPSMKTRSLKYVVDTYAIRRGPEPVNHGAGAKFIRRYGNAFPEIIFTCKTWVGKCIMQIGLATDNSQLFEVVTKIGPKSRHGCLDNNPSKENGIRSNPKCYSSKIICNKRHKMLQGNSSRQWDSGTTSFIHMDHSSRWYHEPSLRCKFSAPLWTYFGL